MTTLAYRATALWTAHSIMGLSGPVTLALVRSLRVGAGRALLCKVDAGGPMRSDYVRDLTHRSLGSTHCLFTSGGLVRELVESRNTA